MKQPETLRRCDLEETAKTLGINFAKLWLHVERARCERLIRESLDAELALIAELRELPQLAHGRRGQQYRKLIALGKRIEKLNNEFLRLHGVARR